ncbi:MAG: hypothetical protein GVY31_03585 [Alphaproteobacteria bacterium]|jgi:hypothetical protein|nr:hypothetical protein [Alphaproteobacteria bacterium]
MSAAIVYTLLTVAAGLVVVIVVPLIWTRIGGALGMLLGILAIPLVWGLFMLVGARFGVAIWGATAAPENVPAQTKPANLLIMIGFAAAAIALSVMVARTGRDE